MNNRDEDKLREGLRDYVESITSKSKGDKYVCPLCGSGTGIHGTGAFSITKENRWKCFSCGEGGDLFDLIGKHEGIKEYQEQKKRAEEFFGVYKKGGDGAKNASASGMQRSRGKSKQVQPAGNEERDFTEFFLEANGNIGKTAYHRGLSLDTLNRFKIGYVENWRHPKVPQTVPASARLIIPISKSSYLARAVSKEVPKDYAKQKVGRTQIFNAGALQSAEKPIFVVEGELDAMSIVDVGGEAIALGSISMVRRFLKLVEESKPVQPIVVALDNEKDNEKKERVEKASQTLCDGLKRLKIPFYKGNPAGEYKDANEALQSDRETFTRSVMELESRQYEAVAAQEEVWQEKEEQEQVERENALLEQQEAEREERNAYLKTSAVWYLDAFLDGIADSVNTPSISTGFEKLDKVLDGGLYEGLYIVGAISSLGKTTLVTQMADQIAQSGQDVLLFSLEMARTELMAKSISRHTIRQVLYNGEEVKNAKTTRGITTWERYEKYSDAEWELIEEAINVYRQYADRIYIQEGLGDIGAEQIRETVQEHIRSTGNTPVVIVDYLQILAPYNERATDKQNTDKAVLELKRISRDFKTPVIGISSFNRASYSTAVTMEAFKESGAIEYSSDVLIGLQLKGAGTQGFDVLEAKRANPREVELVILKNRNGRTGDTIQYLYYPSFNYFMEG